MTHVTVNGLDVDLDRAFPLTLKDWRTLKSRGVTPHSLQQGADADQIHALVHHILSKAEPRVTEADVDALSMRGAALKQVMAVLQASEAENAADRPT